MRTVLMRDEEEKMEKKDLKSMMYDEVLKEMAQIGLPSFRGKQIYSWLHEKLVPDFEQMSNLSKTLRTQLEESYNH